MSFFSMRRKHRGEQVTALFDIGSGSVGGALVSLKDDHIPVIHYTERTPITFQLELQHDRLVDEMIRTLGTTARSVHQQYVKLRAAHEWRGDLREARCILASPWYVSRTHLIKLRREKPFVVSHRFLEDTIAKAEEQFRQQVKSGETASGTLVRMEQSVMHTTLNGYPTSDPYGKQAERLEAALYLSLIGESLSDDIIRTLREEIAAAHTSLHSFMLMAFLAARDMYEHEDDFLLIDVSGEVTDIGVVRDGILLESISFPWGRHYLLREVAKLLGTIPEEAHTLLRAKHDTSGDTPTQAVRDALSQAEEHWLRALEGACAELAEEERLPKHVLLATDADLAEWFTRVIGRDECGQYTFTREPFSVELLSNSPLRELYTFERTAKFDPFLALEAVSCNRVQSL